MCPHHPKVCKLFRDLGYCKFSEYYRFNHKLRKLPVQDSIGKGMNVKLSNIENDLKDKSEKCEFTTNSESDLRIHTEDSHKRNKNIICLKCHFTTKVKGDLTTHNDK